MNTFVEFDYVKILESYKEYRSKNEMGITSKQIKYIQELYDNITDPDTKKEYTPVISNLKELEDDELFSLIESIKRKSKMTIFQCLRIMNLFDDDDIMKLLKKDMMNLTVKDAELLLNPPDKFTAWVREHPLVSEEEWEYGWQESNQCKNGKLEYLKFYNMMMLDLDSQEVIEKELISKLKRYTFTRFRLYKTYGGYHIFITSRLINYRDSEIFQLTKELGTDIYYTLFAYKTGFKVRITPKLDRQEPFVSKYICDVGTIPMDPICDRLIRIHDSHFK